MGDHRPAETPDGSVVMGRFLYATVMEGGYRTVVDLLGVEACTWITGARGARAPGHRGVHSEAHVFLETPGCVWSLRIAEEDYPRVVAAWMDLRAASAG